MPRGISNTDWTDFAKQFERAGQQRPELAFVDAKEVLVFINKCRMLETLAREGNDSEYVYLLLPPKEDDDPEEVSGYLLKTKIGALTSSGVFLKVRDLGMEIGSVETLLTLDSELKIHGITTAKTEALKKTQEELDALIELEAMKEENEALKQKLAELEDQAADE